MIIGCNFLHFKALRSSQQQLMTEAPKLQSEMIKPFPAMPVTERIKTELTQKSILGIPTEIAIFAFSMINIFFSRLVNK